MASSTIFMSPGDPANNRNVLLYPAEQSVAVGGGGGYYPVTRYAGVCPRCARLIDEAHRCGCGLRADEELLLALGVL